MFEKKLSDVGGAYTTFVNLTFSMPELGDQESTEEIFDLSFEVMDKLEREAEVDSSPPSTPPKQ